MQLELESTEHPETTNDHGEVNGAETRKEIFEEEAIQDNETPSTRVEKEFGKNLINFIRIHLTTRPRLPILILKRDKYSYLQR